MSDEARGYTEGEWSGLPQFQCRRCAFSVADKIAEKAERRMQEHVAAHLGLPPDAIMGDSESVVLDFASDEAAERFMELDEDAQQAVARRLQASEGSGATGAHTVADVRQAADEAVTEEE